MQFLNTIGNNIAFALLGTVSVVVIILLILAWRNPVLFRMALRNIPRRPGQSALIVIGLTLSTIIIVASFATGDTLNYSVQRQAVAAYGTIDEILAPPLLSLLAGMAESGGAQNDTQAAAQTEISNLFAGGLTSVLTVLQGGLPGIGTDRLAQLKTEAAAEPLIDGVAGSILFPTIIRNVNTGQGEPIGFIFAVDNDYDQTFGITSVDGRKLEVESLASGVGPIFQGAANAFGAAGGAISGLGINLSVESIAAVAGGIIALTSGAQTGDLSAIGNIAIDNATLEGWGIDTQPLKDRGITQLRVADLLEVIPGLRDLLASTLGITGTLGVTDTATISALQSLLNVGPMLSTLGITATQELTTGAPITGAAPATPGPSASSPVLTSTAALTSTTTGVTDVPAQPEPGFSDYFAPTVPAGPELVVPNVGVISDAALTQTATVTAAAAITATPAATGITGIVGSVIQQGSDLLSSINLNTLGSDLDKSLGQVGLQLRQGDVYLNRLGAEQLGAQTGDLLEVFIGPIPVPFRVRAIIEEASPLGSVLPVVMMRLDEAQQLLFMQGKVNNVLVSNQGDMLQGVAHTAAVSSRLRELAMEPDVLAEAADILRQPAVRTALEAEVGLGVTGDDGQEIPAWAQSLVSAFAPNLLKVQEQIDALPAALDAPGVSPDLRAALANTDLRSRLLQMNMPEAARTALSDAFSRLNKFDVLDVFNKQTVLTAANAGGTLFSSLFSVFGFFSVLAGIILIFLIFVMLAAERRSEMGIARAIGVQRRHLIQMFVSEGMVYSLLAAAVGVLIGLAISFVLINYLGSIVNSVAGQITSSSGGILDFAFHVSWRSIVISYTLGVLFTFFVITISSWRVSRLNIVAAIRDLPDETNARRLTWGKRLRSWIAPLLMLALAGVIGYYGYQFTLWSAVLVGITVALFGVMNIVGLILAFTPLRRETAQRIVYTVVGLGLLALWITPWQRVLPTIGLASFTGDPTQILAVFAIGGPMIITGAIMAIMFNATVFTWIIERLFGWIGSLTPVLKTAIAYPLSSRFRTGTAMVLFAMIMATVIIMAMVIQATQSLIVQDVRQTAGFTIKASNTLLSFFSPLGDMEPEIAKAEPDYPLLAQVEHVGSIAHQEVGFRTTGPTQIEARVDFSGMSSGYIAQAATVYSFVQRAEGYADDAAVWEALRTRDDVVVVRTSMAEYPVQASHVITAEVFGVQKTVQSDDNGMSVAFDAEGPQGFAPRGLRIDGVTLDKPFAPVMVELLDDSGSQRRVKRVEIIGVLEDGDMLQSNEMQGNIRILDSLLGKTVSRSDYYLTAKPGADVRAVAQEVERAFLSSGVNATVMADGFAQTQALLRNILRLLQGFMALGLLVGIAGLGVITTRTVVERRQQVGMLRALGYQARMVALSFVLEASFIAITGILIGAATGIVLGLNFVAVVAGSSSGYHIPWGSISFVVLLAYGFALLTTIIPAWQASRIYPAEALRYE